MLAGARRTVTTWLRAAGLSERFRSCYIAVGEIFAIMRAGPSEAEIEAAADRLLHLAA